jgi:Asp-tRNA(Asn)/Glu-tRNA(Gln) amidotransferase A subunit family amidase
LGVGHDELTPMDATSQAAAVKWGDVSASELTDAAIEGVERLNPAPNAVIHERFAPARVHADAFSDRDAPFCWCGVSCQEI